MAGWEAGGGAAAGAAGAAAGGIRRAMSSGRIITAMKAAASPTTADTAVRVRIPRNGLVYMSRIFLIGGRL